MKRKVEVNVLGGVELPSVDKTQDVNITGRLLGVVSIIEGTKIMQNNKVAKRMVTVETVTLADTLKGLETLAKGASGRDSYGRVVVAIASMKAETEEKETLVSSRQLLLSAPVSLVSETAQGTNNLSRAILTCDDDSLIIIEEKEIE